MNDKTFERASQIKDDLWKLKSLKRELERCVHIGIDLSRIEVIRKPFIDTTERVIAELENEYKDL